MVNTWIAATLVAVVAGIVGFFVVIRGVSFAAHALPLSAFPGAAAANLIGVDPLIGLLVFSGLGVAGISQLARGGRRDLATALSLVMLLGLGRCSSAERRNISRRSMRSCSAKCSASATRTLGQSPR